MILMREVEAKARITEQLSRFLPPHVVDKMAQRGNLIQRSGRELVGTIIFVDIRGFTNLSEDVGPAEVVNMLNDYFERVRNKHVLRSFIFHKTKFWTFSSCELYSNTKE